MLPEDQMHENAEDRAWQELKDTVDQAYDEMDHCRVCGKKVYGPDSEPHADDCQEVRDVMQRDEPHFKFIDE